MSISHEHPKKLMVFVGDRIKSQILNIKLSYNMEWNTPKKHAFKVCFQRRCWCKKMD